MSADATIRAAVLTSSDRCAAGAVVDQSGPAVCDFVRVSLGGEVIHAEILPDDQALIEGFLRKWSDPAQGIDLALVTGGTGLGPRDCTPEAAMRVIQRPHPGLMELARLRCMEASRLRSGQGDARPFLSRAVAGATNSTLIVTLPGSPKGALETLGAIADILPHAIRMLRGDGSPTAHRS